MTEYDKKFFDEACKNKVAVLIQLIYKMLDTNKDKALMYLLLHKLQYEIIKSMDIINNDIDIENFFSGEEDFNAN